MVTQEQSSNFWVREQRLSGVLVAILPHSQDIPTVGMLQCLARVLLDEKYSDSRTINIDDLLQHHPYQYR